MLHSGPRTEERFLPSRSEAQILDGPFFTLEYDEATGSLRRLPPPGVRDHGDGSFSRGNIRWRFPEGEAVETEILRGGFIRGKDILTLIRTGPHPLVREGPVPAAPGERLMEFSARGTPGEGKLLPAAGKKKPPGSPGRAIVITLREIIPRHEWKPLAGLPNHRLCRGRIYEIIGDKVLAEIFGGSGVRVLEDGGIPLFADTYARLIYLFADEQLRNLLSQERVFIPEGELALTLVALTRFRRGVGTVYGIPAVRYGKKHYAARALSRELGRGYIPLGDRWARRRALEDLGLGPRETYAGGGPIGPVSLSPGEVLASGAGLEGFWTDFEWKDAPWGAGTDPLFAHLEFLRSCGISGGLVIPETGTAARFLLGYLSHLSRKIEDGRALCLVPQACFGDFLQPGLPAAGAASPSGTIPVLFTEGGHSIFSPHFRGLGLGFYEELPKNPRLLKSPWDILILLRPDRVLADSPATAEGICGEWGKIRTRLTLGIFADGDELFFNPAGAKLRGLFGIRGKPGEPGAAVIRLPGPGASLPRKGVLSPRRVRRGPRPFDGEAGENDEVREARQAGENGTAFLSAARFRLEAKFRNLPAPELQAEQELFFRQGKRAPYTPGPAAPGERADFNRLSREEADYFFYWRGLCRRGRYLPADPGYIRIYARELILSMGGGPPEDQFRELLALWLNYRGEFPGLDEFFPQWLADFGVLYGAADRLLPELIPLAGETGSFLLRDLFLHRRYIEGDHQIVFTDIRDLLPRDLAEGVFRGELSGRGPERQGEIALGGIDRYLREAYGMRFFEFFYPSFAAPVLIRAFEGLRGAGYSAYTAEWIRFHGHKPLEDFLEALVRYVLYRLRLGSGFERPGREPPLDPLWKYLIDRELGFPGCQRPVELGPEEINLETARVEALRNESEAVRELLRIDPGEELGFPFSPALPEEPRDRTLTVPAGEKPVPPGTVPAPSPPALGAAAPWAASPGASSPAAPLSAPLAAFLGELGTTEREALGLLLREGTREALEALARNNHTMPEFLLDTINEAFWGIFQDLLIETRGGKPEITGEYAADLAAALSARGG